MRKLYLALLSLSLAFVSQAQVNIMTGNNSGGFENGPSFAMNSWTSVNGPFNQWAVGTGSVYVGTRGAYIGDATNYTGTANASITHFYRNNFNIPAGATNALLYFRYRQPVVDPGNDSLIVSVCLSTQTPVAGTTPSPAFTRVYANTATAYAGYTLVGPIDLTAFANNNLRLVFTHVNNGVFPHGVPAIDSVNLTYCAAITGTMTMCTGGNVNLATTTNVTTATWTSSALASIGASTSLNATVVAGSTAGTAIITHTGGSCSVTATVTINPVPTAITGTAEACAAGGTTVLSSTPSGGTWSSSAAGTASVAGGTVTGGTAGTANITYMFAPACRAVTTVTVNALPNVQTVNGGGTFCASGTGVPVGMISTDNGVDYTLYNGASTIATVAGTGSGISFGTISTAGTYTATATNTTTGCTNDMAGSATVNVTAPVTPDVNISSTAPTTLCSGTAVSFTANPTNEGVTPTYNWYVNGAYVGGGTGYSYIPANGDIVRVALYPGGICVDPDSVVATNTMAVTPLGTPGVSIAVTPGIPSCAGRTVTCTATPSLGGTTPGYRWTKNGINVATGPSYAYIPANGDIVYCMITSNYICRSIDTAFSSNTTMVTIPSAALPVVSIAASPGTTVDPGTLVTLLATYTSGTSLVNYQWHVNGLEIPGATSDVYSSDAFVNGDIVTCKVINTDPCANFTLKSVVINTTATGINAIDLSTRIAVVPNPNHGTFTVMGSVFADAATIKVTNLMGQTVYAQDVQVTNNTVKETVNLSHLSAGMYLLSINTADGTKTMHFTITE